MSNSSYPGEFDELRVRRSPPRRGVPQRAGAISRPLPRNRLATGRGCGCARCAVAQRTGHQPGCNCAYCARVRVRLRRPLVVAASPWIEAPVYEPYTPDAPATEPPYAPDAPADEPFSNQNDLAAPDAPQPSSGEQVAEIGAPPASRGSRAHIRWVQGALNQILGLRLATDGVMGLQTRSAVRTFQQRQNLKPDGVVGPKTEAALRAVLQSRPTGTRPSPRRVQHVTLDDFDFDRDVLKPAHRQQLAAVVQRIVRSQQGTQAVPVVRIVGHTDPVGTDAYNVALGRRRAERAARELRSMLARLNPAIARRTSFAIESRGEREPVSSSPARNRRVEIILVASPGRRGRTIPPDTSGCGMPATLPQREAYFNRELNELETVARVRRAQPALCLFQNAEQRSHRNHFQFQAQRWALRIGAIADPNSANCNLRIGPTSYDAGADIIRAIEAAHACLGRRQIKAVHIFSHSGPGGVFGPHGFTQGLYRDEPDAASRSGGARRVTDIPVAVFANDVVFVLHGCNTANGDDSFARALFNHLAATLTNPKVFGHTTLGCAGRDSNWREFSRRTPNGRSVSSIAPHYAGSGGCG